MTLFRFTNWSAIGAPMTSLNIGLRQAKRLAGMNFDERIEFITEGLPVILESARTFRDAALALSGHKREAEVLFGFNEEESAKGLILVDMLRCPKKLLPSRVGKMTGWFYNHLARLIYVEACHMKPMHVAQLQEYADLNRLAHHVDGDYGEYIFPNQQLFSRESTLYADIAAYEDGKLFW